MTFKIIYLDCVCVCVWGIYVWSRNMLLASTTDIKDESCEDIRVK